MTAHSNILAWRIPWTQEPSRLQTMGSQRVGQDGATITHLVITSCTMLQVSIHSLQALCLPDIIPWIYLSPPLYNHKIFDRSYMNGLVVFPTFFNLSLNLQLEANVLSHSQLQSVRWLYRASLSLDAKNIINMMSREYICGADRPRFLALTNVIQVVSNWAAIFAVNLFYFFHLYMTLSSPKPCTSLANRRVSVCACSVLSDSLRPSGL